MDEQMYDTMAMPAPSGLEDDMWLLPFGAVAPNRSNDIAITCKICGTDCINPPPEMQTFPVCEECLEFLRKLRCRQDELIQS